LSKKTTQAITGSDNHYLIGVKNNQPKLYKQIKQLTGDKSQISSAYTELEVNKGRTELRHTCVSDSISSLSSEWKGVQQIVRLQRIIKQKGKTTKEVAYFISSRKANALFYSEGVRAHWAIENTLHLGKGCYFKGRCFQNKSRASPSKPLHYQKYSPEYFTKKPI
jgi:predicted transposase YbfD/YdcC